jgi:hypothetical protein
MTKNELVVHHDHKISFKGKSATFTILGSLPMDLSALRVTIHLTSCDKRKQRFKLDLYNYSQLQRHCQELCEKEDYNYLELETDFLNLTDQLEKLREQLFEDEFSLSVVKDSEISLVNEKHAIDFLKQENLLQAINIKLGEAGIINEVNNRMLLFISGLGYKSRYPLHVLVNSSSGSGKSHLINTIADCFPQEDVVSLTRVTSKSFYHYRKGELDKKLLLIQDFDGLDKEALFALRELQSLGSLCSSYTHKDRYGNLSSKTHTVYAHFSSLSVTTKATYLDNQSRSILLKIDESKEQTKRIIEYQNRINSGAINLNEQKKVKLELSNAIRLIKDMEVVNPLATKIVIPGYSTILRRLNKQFQDFTCLITIVHQYQRKQTEERKLIATKEDVKMAIELFFDSICLKFDELDGALRLFFERLKLYLQSRDKINKIDNKSFTQREVRQSLILSKSQCQRYFKALLELEYIQLNKASQTKGHVYKVIYWDDYESARESINSNLLDQLRSIREK